MGIPNLLFLLFFLTSAASVASSYLLGSLRELSTSPNFDILLGLTTSIEFGEVVPLSNDGFILTGGLSSSQLIAIATNQLGEVAFATTLASPTDQLKAVDGLQTSQGEIILLVKVTTPQSLEKMALAKLSSSGGLVWSKEISGGVSSNTPHYLSITQVGDVILVGETQNLGVGGDNIALAVDGDGQLQWASYFGGPQRDVLSRMRPLSNGGFILCGFTFSFSNIVLEDILLVRMADNGSIAWSRRMGYSDKRSVCNDVTQSADGSSIYFVGTHTGTQREAIYGKVNIDGTKEWVRVITDQGNINGKAIIEMEDGSLLIASDSDTLGGSQNNILLSSASSLSGDLSQTRAYSSTTTTSVFSLLKMSDGTVAVGAERQNSQEVTNFQIIKLESNLSYCGALSESTVSPQTRDLSSDPAYLFQTAAMLSLPSLLFSSLDLPLTHSDATSSVSRISSSTACQLYSQASASSLSSSLPSSASCSCSSHGQCNLLGKCECASGFSGFSCQYPDSQFSTLSSNITSFLSSLSSTQGSLSTDEVLSQLSLVNAHPDLVETASALTVVQILQSRVLSNSSSSQLDSTFSTLSLLSIVAALRFDSSISLPLSLSSFTVFLGISSLSALPPLSIDSSLIDLNIINPLTSSSLGTEYLPSSNSSTSVILPSSLPIDSSSALLSILWFEHIYNSIRPSGFRSCSPVLSLILLSQGAEKKVANLDPPLIIRFPVDRNITQLAHLLDDIFSRKSRTKKQVISSKDLQCLFYDQASRSLSEEGCFVSDITQQSIECSCNHLTDFMAFVRGSYEPFQSANYNSFSALASLTWKRLLRNFGFFFSLAFFFSFILSTTLCGVWDKKKLKTQVTKMASKEMQPQQSINAKTSQSDLRSNTLQDIRLEVKENKQSYFKKVRSTLSSIYQKTQEKKRRCKCCAFCLQVGKYEIRTNNQIYNLFSLTSLLLPRLVRVVFLFLVIIIEFAVNAFFFDLSQPEGAFDESPFSTENMIENFWTGIYTALVGIVIMFPISLCFYTRKKEKKKIDFSLSIGKFILQFQKIKKTQRTKIALTLTFFLLFSAFCCLYMIGFCETASVQAQGDWLISSVMAVVIEMTLFELFPAFMVGVLAVMVFGCKAHRLLCLIICIEAYRALRNIVGT